MTNFDELMVETLRVHPNVRAVFRVDGPDVMGLYVVDVEDDTAPDVEATIRSRVNADLSVGYGRPPENQEGVTLLWERTADTVGEVVRKSKPKERKAPAGPPPLNELVASLREVLLAERNKLALEGVVPETLGGYIFDVSDPCCPPKFKEMMGGDKFINHCRAGGKLPLAVGVMPRRIIAKHIEPLARKVEKVPASPIFYADAPVPRSVLTIENWNVPNEMVVVTGYQRALGLKSIVVPSVITLER